MATASIPTEQPEPDPRGRNPLRRRSDDLRNWLPALLGVSLSVVGSLCVLLGLHLYDASRASAVRQAEMLHRVATVAATQPFRAGVDVTLATLDWTDLTGRHTVQATVPAGTRPGDQVTIWVDRNDVPQAAPPAAAQSAGTAVSYAVAVLAGSVTFLTCGYAWARHALDKRVDRAWEQEWALVEPEWSRRG